MGLGFHVWDLDLGTWDPMQTSLENARVRKPRESPPHHTHILQLPSDFPLKMIFLGSCSQVRYDVALFWALQT